MPIHLYWGDDATARERAVQELIDQVIEPAWVSLNLSRLDGNSGDQAAQALNEARTAPFGGEGVSCCCNAAHFASAARLSWLSNWRRPCR